MDLGHPPPPKKKWNFTLTSVHLEEDWRAPRCHSYAHEYTANFYQRLNTRNFCPIYSTVNIIGIRSRRLGPKHFATNRSRNATRSNVYCQQLGHLVCGAVMYIKVGGPLIGRCPRSQVYMWETGTPCGLATKLFGPLHRATVPLQPDE